MPKMLRREKILALARTHSWVQNPPLELSAHGLGGN
jgi:hypothetical protein